MDSGKIHYPNSCQFGFFFGPSIWHVARPYEDRHMYILYVRKIWNFSIINLTLKINFFFFLNPVFGRTRVVVVHTLWRKKRYFFLDLLFISVNNQFFLAARWRISCWESRPWEKSVRESLQYIPNYSFGRRCTSSHWRVLPFNHVGGWNSCG